MLEASARLAGARHSIHFGPERQKQLSAAREDELIALSEERCAPAPPECRPNFTGGEHDVWIGDPPTHVIKRTLPGFYGRIPDEKLILNPADFSMRSMLTLRSALPSEYMVRWAITEAVFGLPTEYCGCSASKEGPLMVVSQLFIDQDDADPATLEDVEDFMTKHGFERVDAQYIALPEIAGVTWYRQRDGILIADAHARNFRKHATEGFLVPVDLMVALVPPGASRILPDATAVWSQA